MQRSPLNQTQGECHLPVGNKKILGEVLSYEVNPAITSSPGDILGNTNNKITTQTFPQHVSHFGVILNEFYDGKVNAKQRSPHKRKFYKSTA